MLFVRPLGALMLTATLVVLQLPARAVPAPAPASDALIMFEQAGCPYCATWNKKVGAIYAKTDEGKLLPLQRVDIHGERPFALRALGGVRFTPTFVVLHCGREFARITGYIGDDQFWGLLDASVKALKESPACPP